jgi:hypothetical protein
MNDAPLMLRQIHPGFIKQGQITSQAFRPTIKDDKKLSVYDNDMISAEKAYEHYTKKHIKSSAGVMAVSVKECNELSLPVVSDPAPFPEHALIDFSDYSYPQSEKLAKKLRQKAVERDWLYVL